MFGMLNHLAITSDHYTLLGMFYRAMFGLKVSGDTAREIGAISVGDGYVGMTLIPRRGGRKAGLDHFGIGGRPGQGSRQGRKKVSRHRDRQTPGKSAVRELQRPRSGRKLFRFVAARPRKSR